MHKFVRGLITEWRRLGLPFQNAAFVVAVSGGADSVALLLAIEELRRAEKLRNRILVAHFNHKLRGDEAENDEQFVKHLAGTFKFELILGHARLPDSGNVEQNARIARYEFLRKSAENIGAVAVLTAHTVNDQAETFLMNLIRGSGPDGLGGMKAVREMVHEESSRLRESETKKRERGETSISESPLLPFAPSPLLLIRPILGWAKRQDTEGYCRDRDVEYRYDSMNEDLGFTRVRIRKLLLPMLEEFNPKIVETLANTALLMQGGAEGGKAQPPASSGGFCGEKGIARAYISENLRLAELKTLAKPELYRLVRQWLAEKRGSSRGLSLKHIEAVERLILSRKSGKTVELPDGGTVTRKDGALVYTDLKVEKRPFGN